MTSADFVLLAVVAVSAIVAFVRGFVREVLGIAAWAAAAYVAYKGFPLANPTVRGWISNPQIADYATYGIVFVLALIVCTVVTNLIGRMAVPPAEWPQPVRAARLLPFTHDGAVWLAGMLPAQFRPKVAGLDDKSVPPLPSLLTPGIIGAKPATPPAADQGATPAPDTTPATPAPSKP
jgi:membrane protein required for colicin V production